MARRKQQITFPSFTFIPPFPIFSILFLIFFHFQLKLTQKQMKLLILFIVLAFANLALAYHGPLKANNTPKAPDNWTDACDECQTIIKRIVEVAKDPAKVAELKVLLSVLCRETHYQEECRLFVSKLDLFLERLLPYLRDAHHVCEELRICGNRELEQFHRVGMLYAKKYANQQEGKNSLVCEECQFAAHELLELVDNPHVQQDVQDWLQENVCTRMGTYKDLCDNYMEEVLPELFLELHNMLSDQKKFCEDLELCPANAGSASGEQLRRPKLLPDGNITRQNAMHQFLNKLFFQQNHGIQPIQTTNSPLCAECKIFVEAIRYELSRNHTVYVLAEELAKVCAAVPKQMTEGCEDFMEIYAPAIVFLSVQHFLNQSVCNKTHLCNTEQFASIPKTQLDRNSARVKCLSCRTVSDVLSMELSNPSLQDELIQDLEEYLCERVPTSWFAICDNLVKSFIPLAVTEMIRELQDDKICYMIHACKKRT